MSVVKSLSFDQGEILRGISALHLGGRTFDADLTYGNGQFYKHLTEPALRFDIDTSLQGVTHASSTSLPLEDNSITSAIFDPPFLTYVRAGREGNGKMIMSGRFSGYWTYQELEDHYRATIEEAHRVISRGGMLVIKCQDIIHNHRMHCTHANVIDWCYGLFRLKDLYVLGASHRLPAPNRKGTQKHARIFHSYFIVLESLKGKKR